MSKLHILNFQYNLMKKLPSKPRKWLSLKDRQVSDLMPAFQPNEDEMLQVFRKIDKNNDGKISVEELKFIVEALGRKDAASEAKSKVQVAGLDKDWCIDFKEFMEVNKKITKGDIRSAFWVFDQNGDGRISAEEVRAILSKLGENCGLEECQRIVAQVDKNGDGLVDMEDFMAMMTSTMKPV